MTTTIDFLRSVITSANDAVVRLANYPELDNEDFRKEAQRLDGEVVQLRDDITAAIQRSSWLL